MNKKLLAIAVGAAMVAGAATAADEPTFYAKIHMSIDSMDNGGSDTTTPAGKDGIFVSSNSSRLGIKGAVDLDGGMKAVYKYEMSTNYSSNGDVNGNRNAYLGLKGGFGQVIAGRHDMPFKTVGRKHDLFGDTIGDNRAITRLNGAGDDWADRRDNVVMYSNKFGPVGLKVAYAPDEGKDDSEDMGIGIDYTQGPLKIMFANETHGTGNLTGGTDDSSGNIIAGSYAMGNITLAAGYLAISSIGGDPDLDASGYTLAAAMKAGANTFKLQYTASEADGATVDGLDTQATVTAIGVDHKLGKKTSVYAMYAAVANDTNTAYTAGGGGHDSTVSGVPDETTSGFSLGMIHKF